MIAIARNPDEMFSIKFFVSNVFSKIFLKQLLFGMPSVYCTVFSLQSLVVQKDARI